MLMEDICKIALFLLMVLYVISSNVISKKHVRVNLLNLNSEIGWLHPSAPLLIFAIALSYGVYKLAPPDH